MKWSRAKTRFALILGALLSAGALATWLVRIERPTTIEIGRDGWQDDRFRIWTTLTFKDFDAPANRLKGSVDFELFPREQVPSEYTEFLKEFSSILLRLDHATSHGDQIEGGNDEPVKLILPPASGSMHGKGSFYWVAVPQRGAFFYPFDRYLLHVKPSILEVHLPDVYPNYSVSQLVMDFGNSNFVPTLRFLNPKKSTEDTHEMILQRPAMLRLLAAIVGVLLVFWLIYLATAAKPDQYTGGIVSLFIGVFSIRSSLLSGAPLFPSLMDYCALAIYLLATLIILIKWFIPDRTNSRECPLCFSSIHARAIVCPQCTREIAFSELHKEHPEG